MILEDATYEAYGYYSGELKPQSHKPIIAICNECGAFKLTSNHTYCFFCNSCSRKFTEEHKRNIRKNHVGNTGKTFTTIHKTKLSAALRGSSCR